MTTTGLAAAVRARYARHPAFVPAPAMALAARPVPVTLRSLHRHDQYLLWGPRLSFVLAESRNRAAFSAGGASAPPGAVRREKIETVVQRIFSRVERVEGTPAPPGRTLPIAAAPERVFHASRATGSPTVSAASPAPAVAPSAREAARWPGWPRPAVAAASLPPVDVERLTDQVVHSIGRRMSAYRERLGR